jgi:hypothetical protein
MDLPVYKLALDIPKTSDLTWLLSHTKNPPVPSPASCNTRPFLEPSCLSVLQNIKSFQKAPLSAALPSRLYPQTSTLKDRHLLNLFGLGSDPKTSFGHVGPPAVITTLLAKETI